LALANRVRSQRALLKAELKQGHLSPLPLIAKPPDYLASASVLELLLALPGFGPRKAARLLERCRIASSKTLGGLSERQRRELTEELP
jgi:hypothetical protein